MTTEPFKANPKAPIDCFYVYPTVSNDPGVLSDMHADTEELNVVKAQLARFGSKCRIYAPLYRQFTLTALRARMTGKPMDMTGVRPATTYEDVARQLELLPGAREQGPRRRPDRPLPGLGPADPADLQGNRRQAGAGEDRLRHPDGHPPAGATRARTPALFKSMPLCQSASQTGCVIAYASFRDTIPPPAGSLFGKASGDQIAACSNPAALGGGTGSSTPT